MIIEGPGLFLTILAFLLVIGPLVFVHELGHYFVGRWFGVKAETFSIGFGRSIGGWTDKRGTYWKIGWLPLGGYVKFKGDMNPASTPTDEWLALPAEERAQTFQAKPVWQRFLIVLAGPMANFLFAILALTAVFAATGVPTTRAVVAEALPGTVAERTGFRAGDEIVGIDGTRIETFADLYWHVRLRPGQELDFRVLRDDRLIHISARPQPEVQSDEFGNRATVGVMGIRPGTLRIEKLPVHQLAGAAVKQTLGAIEMMVVSLRQVIFGERSVKELGGPLKMAQLSGQQASLGWLQLFGFMIVISINLGFINLLPIPLLDGGHLLFYTLEAVRRRPVPAEVQEWAFRTGLLLLLGLMAFVTINDLASFGLFSRLGGLIG